MNYIIGIDLGGTTAKIALVEPNGEIFSKWEVKTRIESEGQYIIPDIIESIQHVLKEKNISLENLLGIGMGSPGQVDLEQRTVVGAYNLNWKTVQPVGAELTKAFGVPVYIDNDANVAGLGERWMGAGNKSDHVVFVTLGTGVGGGVIANGRLLHGISGSAGEIGHMTVETNHPFTCTCGKDGCLETVASATGLVNLARCMKDKETEPSQLKELLETANQVTAKDIFDLAKENDSMALKVVEQFSQYLGLALSQIANILNPEFIVIGGGVSQAGQFLIDHVIPHYEKYLFPQIKETSHLALAQLGNDAGVLGAASLVLMNESK